MVPVALQVLHRPPAAPEQPFSQHTPSVQNPLWHSLDAAQVAPFPFGPQVGAPEVATTQLLGATQSWACVAVVHVVLQAPELHWKVPHDKLPGVTQAPLPSQVEAGVTTDVLAQTAGLQFVLQ